MTRLDRIRDGLDDLRKVRDEWPDLLGYLTASFLIMLCLTACIAFDHLLWGIDD